MSTIGATPDRAQDDSSPCSPAEDVTPDERFAEFHKANPHVYAELVRAARLFREQTGRAKCGMSLLFGRVRWVLALETSGDAFRLNNNFVPFYSRLVMAQEPDLAGMFDIRRSVADEVAA